MRKVIILWGSHCAGKTEFCKTLESVVDANKVLIVFGDTDKRFNAEAEIKRQEVLRVLREDRRHLVFEGMRAPSGVLETILDNRESLNYSVRLVISVMAPERMLHHMKNRKAKRGRDWTPKLEAYWDKAKLEYESSWRFVNKVRKLGEVYPSDAMELSFIKLSDNVNDFSAWIVEFEHLMKVLK